MTIKKNYEYYQWEFLRRNPDYKKDFLEVDEQSQLEADTRDHDQNTHREATIKLDRLCVNFCSKWKIGYIKEPNEDFNEEDIESLFPTETSHESLMDGDSSRTFPMYFLRSYEELGTELKEYYSKKRPISFTPSTGNKKVFFRLEQMMRDNKFPDNKLLIIAIDLSNIISTNNLINSLKNLISNHTKKR